MQEGLTRRLHNGLTQRHGLAALFKILNCEPIYRNHKPQRAVAITLERILKAINERPEGKHYHPQICLDSVHGRLRCLTPPGATLFYWDVYYHDRFSLEFTIAIDAIIQLAKSDSVNHVRKCICGRWFFGKDSNHKSCSRTCSARVRRGSKKGRQKSTESQRHRRANRWKEAKLSWLQEDMKNKKISISTYRARMKDIGSEFEARWNGQLRLRKKGRKRNGTQTSRRNLLH
jgi:hypothetical protein